MRMYNLELVSCVPCEMQRINGLKQTPQDSNQNLPVGVNRKSIKVSIVVKQAQESLAAAMSLRGIITS